MENPRNKNSAAFNVSSNLVNMWIAKAPFYTWHKGHIEKKDQHWVSSGILKHYNAHALPIS